MEMINMKLMLFINPKLNFLHSIPFRMEWWCGICYRCSISLWLYVTF